MPQEIRNVILDEVKGLKKRLAVCKKTTDKDNSQVVNLAIVSQHLW